MFLEEIHERSRGLVEGAAEVGSGELDRELAGSMLREGHTIKGTGRVMGYEAVARAGEMLEEVWRWLHRGEVEATERLGDALGRLADVLPDAVDDPEILAGPMGAVIIALEGQELPGPLPEPYRGGTVPAEEAETTDEAETTEAVVIPFEPRPDDAEPDASATEEGAAAVDGEAVGLDVATLEEETTAAPGQVGTSAEGEDSGSGETPEGAGAAATEEVEVASEPVAPDGPEPELVADAAAVDDGAAPEPGSVADAAADGAPVELPTTEAHPPTAEGVAFLEFTVESVGPEAKPVIEVDLEAPVVDLDADPVEVPDPPELDGAALFDTDPGPTPPADVDEPTEPAAPGDLGGLLGVLATWASSESVVVNAGGLYRLINDLAAIALELDAILHRADGLVGLTAGGPGAAESLEIAEALREVGSLVGRLEREALELASTRLSTVTGTLPQLARYLGKKVGKEVKLEVYGDDVLVDRQVADRLGEPIRQLVVNAIAHGIERPDERAEVGKPAVGLVTVHAAIDDGTLVVEVTDDGRGIDWSEVAARAVRLGVCDEDPTEEQCRRILIEDGFSTLREAGELAGDGAGLAKVRTVVEELFGTLTITTEPGGGSTFALAVPAHRALQKALVVGAGGYRWGIPIAAVEEVMSLGEAHAKVVAGGTRMVWRGAQIPVAPLSQLVGVDATGLPTHLVILGGPTGGIAVGVEENHGERQVAIKELGALVAGPDFITGAALLGGGDVVLIVDAGRLAERYEEDRPASIGPIRRILVVDDSKAVRDVVASALASAGFATFSADSVAEALKFVKDHPIDAIVVDYSMPRADGIALVQMVRGRSNDVPIVMLSGVASDEDRRRALAAGVDAFFDKADFREGMLADTLRRLIDEKERAAGT